MIEAGTTFVLFGSTGDLALRKILPGLCSLLNKKEYASARVIACGRRPWGDPEYRAFIQPALQELPQETVAAFLERVTYVQGALEDGSLYAVIKKEVGDTEGVYHLALHPESYEAVVHGLGRAGLVGKLMIEKPFGHDAASAEALKYAIAQYFPIQSLFVLDHYLGKKGLREVADYRRMKPQFEARFTSESIASIRYRILENLDVQGRGDFYDKIGALRDVGQSHLLLMLALSLMDLEEAAISTPHARARVLHELRVSEGAVRGQYKGYQDEEGVVKDSQTETYFRITALSESARWQDVPLTLESGKALKEKRTDIEILFKDDTRHVFAIEQPRMQGDYEVLIEAALHGDTSLFVSMEEISASWKLVDEAAKSLARIPLVTYEKGSAVVK